MAVERAVRFLDTAAGIGPRHFFATEHAVDTDATGSCCTVIPAQSVAQLGQQGVMGDLGQIGDLHPVSHSLASGSADDGQGNTLRQRPSCDDGLGLNLITRVNHGMLSRVGHETLTQPTPVGGRDEIIDGTDFALRVDLLNPVAHGVHLGLSQSAGQGMNLTVDVGLCHVIQIHQRDPAHTTAGQRLGGPGTHATDAHDHHVGVKNCLRTADAVEPPQATEPTFEVRLSHSRSISQIWNLKPNQAPETMPATAITLVRLRVDRPDSP